MQTINLDRLDLQDGHTLLDLGCGHGRHTHAAYFHKRCQAVGLDLVTACQQACPADAIYFGDLTDEQATVTQMKRNDRNYLMLEELNVRPRTSYIAKLTNPNPALVDNTMPEAAH